MSLRHVRLSEYGYTCAACGKRGPLVTLGRPSPDTDSADVCGRCLREALVLLDEAARGAA